MIAAEQTLPATSGQVARLEAAAPALTPGTTVGGRYRLVSLVSADDSGHWFWRAKDTVLPRDMAVTMLPDTSGTSATVARTLRAGRLHHIGLPQTLDVGTDHGQSYVVGQWVDGATLTDLLSGGPLEADVATSITAKLSEAVAEAHRNGIALGAINPSLVRVNFDGQVRLSHVIAHGSATPDQDIRAIGALLYLMLTGTWPLGDPIEPGGAGSADGTATGRELAAAPTRLGRELPADEVRPDVPEALSALAERALHPDEPDGIHAVGAIAALLRSPETVAGIAQAPPRPRGQTAQPGRPAADQGAPGQAEPGVGGAGRVRRAHHHRHRRPDQPVRRLDPEQRAGRAADHRLHGRPHRRVADPDGRRRPPRGLGRTVGNRCRPVSR